MSGNHSNEGKSWHLNHWSKLEKWENFWLIFAYNEENLQIDFDVIVRNNFKFQCSKCYHSDSIWSWKRPKWKWIIWTWKNKKCIPKEKSNNQCWRKWFLKIMSFESCYWHSLNKFFGSLINGIHTEMSGHYWL